MTEKRERWLGNGTEEQSPDGNNRQGVRVVRVFTIRGTSLSQRESGENVRRSGYSGTTVKEKTNTWNKSCMESAKREAELYKMVEIAVMDEKQEERERGMIRELLGELRKRREEEDETRNLIEHMQRNFDDAQNKSHEVERKLNRILWEYIEAFDKERGRPRLILTKLWQLMQSRNTTNLNVDKGLDGI